MPRRRTKPLATSPFTVTDRPWYDALVARDNARRKAKAAGLSPQEVRDAMEAAAPSPGRPRRIGDPTAAFDLWIPLVCAINAWAKLEEFSGDFVLSLGWGTHEAVTVHHVSEPVVGAVMKAFIQGAWCAQDQVPPIMRDILFKGGGHEPVA